jgi:hypothetical protein
MSVIKVKFSYSDFTRILPSRTMTRFSWMISPTHLEYDSEGKVFTLTEVDSLIWKMALMILFPLVVLLTGVLNVKSEFRDLMYVLKRIYVRQDREYQGGIYYNEFKTLMKPEEV